MFGFDIPGVWLHIAAGGITAALGIAYLLKTRAMVREFKLVLLAHRRILSMALVSQGIAYCFIGAVLITLAAVAPNDTGGTIVVWACAGTLLILSLWTGSTGARSESVLFRVSHLITIVAVALVLLGNVPGR